MTAPTATPAGRILVVDDDRLVLATLAHGLALAGHEVWDADNGDDAILLARQHRPELALLDVRMEGKSGFDVADYLREVAGTPFLFVTAFSDERMRERAQACGALDCLAKPLEIDQILAVVATWLARIRAGTPLPGGPAEASHEAALANPVALAVGVLMQQHALTRHQAWERLHRAAQAEHLTLTQQAERIVQVVEAGARA